MSDDMRVRRERRSRLLRGIYGVVDASVTEFVSAQEVPEAADLTPEDVRKIVSYLEEKGYLVVDDHRAGVVRITAEGIDAVELGRLEA